MTKVIQVYATSVRKGLKTLEEIPAKDRAEVEAILNEEKNADSNLEETE